MSDNVVDILGRMKRETRDTLKSGGGDGTFDGMEHRIGRLETQMDRVLSELTDIKVLIASVDAKLDSKVDYKWLTVYILGIVAVILRDEILALFK